MKGNPHRQDEPTKRTAAEWQALADAEEVYATQIESVAGKAKAQAWRIRYVDWLKRNAAIAAGHEDGFADVVWDNARRITRSQLGYGDGSNGGNTTRTTRSILSVGDSEAPTKLSDTTGTGEKLDRQSSRPVADKTGVTSSVIIHDTTTPILGTIEQSPRYSIFTIPASHAAPNFPTPDGLRQQVAAAGEQAQVSTPVQSEIKTVTRPSANHFAIGDALVIPNHWGKTYEVKAIFDDEYFEETYYGFATLNSDALTKDGKKRTTAGYYKYYRESELIALNPDVKSITAREEIERRQSKSELISAAYCAIREAISTDNSQLMKTAMHEFTFWWRHLYGAGEVNPADVALFIAGEVPIQLELIA